MKLKEFDTVRLKDGQVGDIMDISDEHDGLVITVGDSPEDWHDIYVTKDDVVEVLQSSN